MKTLRVLSFLLLPVMILPATLKAQCTAATTHSLTFDTLVSGTGNDNYSFTAPQFNPALGTLVAAVIKTSITIGYSFEAENITNSSRVVYIGIGRYDYLTSSVLNNGYYASTLQKNYGPYALGARDGVSGSGPDYLAQGPFYFLNNNVVINDSVTTSTANFLGTGTIDFEYYPSTYSIIPQNLTYTFSAYDTTHFSVTYYYCATSVLASGITDFLAARENASSVKLSWTTLNETAGRVYGIQKSVDGNHFDDIGAVPAAENDSNKAAYIYYYPVSNTDQGKLYFRLKEMNRDGSFSYSEIRVVDIGREPGIGLNAFPNPAIDYVNLSFNQSSAKDWQVAIFAADGRLLQQDFFYNANNAHIPFKSKPAAGVYFIRATERKTQINHTTVFVVK